MADGPTETVITGAAKDSDGVVVVAVAVAVVTTCNGAAATVGVATVVDAAVGINMDVCAG